MNMILVLADPLLERLVARALDARDGFQVIQCDRRRALEQAEDAAVAVVEDKGPEVTRPFLKDLLRRNPQLPVLVLTHDTDPLDHLEAGAMACLGFDADSETIIRYARALVRQESLLDPPVAARLVRRLQQLARLCDDQEVDPLRCEALSPREAEVAERVARGRTNQQIANELDIGLGTVKTHVHNILRKLLVENRREAALYWRLYRRMQQGGAGNGAAGTNGSPG